MTFAVSSPLYRYELIAPADALAAALQPLLTPAIVGAEIARLCQDTDNQDEHREYQLTGHGLHAMA